MPDADDVPRHDVKFGLLAVLRLVGRTNLMHFELQAMNLADVVHIIAGLHHGHQLPMSIVFSSNAIGRHFMIPISIRRWIAIKHLRPSLL